MRLFIKQLFLLILLGGVIAPAYAESFIVKNIRVVGLKGISQDTVISYMPVQSGQRFDSTQSAKIINAIYSSGFFNDVKLAQEGSTLVVTVVERPVIGSIVVTGNKDIPKDKLNAVLKDMGLAQGRVFNNSVLERVKASLENEYEAMGKYNAVVNASVKPEVNNRVAIRVEITEGDTVKISEIKIIGNQAFSSSKLIDEMSIATHHFWSFFTRGDDFAQEKLDASVEALRNYYLNRGYFKIKVDSVQTHLTPDKKSVAIVIQITEGQVYTFKSYHFAGKLIVSESELRSVATIKSGSDFSKEAIQKSIENIGRLLGNLGYAFASINPVPEIDEQNKQVAITFYIDPGMRVYVRRVNFDGNIKTKDVVLRRSVRQMEAAVVNVDDIKESERQLNITGYTEAVNIETAPVADAPDQVDLNFHIKEAPSAQATVGVGYGTNGLVVQAGVNQNNFLGTGKSLGLNFNNSLITTLYSLSYNDPYFTLDGISQGFNLFYQRTNPSKLNGANYTFDLYGGSVNYSLPISAKGDAIGAGFGYQAISLHQGTNIGQEELNFINDNGSVFKQFLINLGWNRNGLDKALFPTKGIIQDAGLQVFLPAGNKALTYYKANYNGQIFYPITSNGFIFMGRMSLGYGAGNHGGLPFFANYFAGGPGFAGQVRGFEANSLGPRDSQNNPLGGNILTAGTLAIIFPNPISSDKLRTSIFVDGGNVFSTLPRRLSGTKSGPMRYASGLSVDWRVPVFNVVMNLSLAKALNAQSNDQLETFSFNVGTNF